MIISIMNTGFYQFNPAFGEKEDNLTRVADALKTNDLFLDRKPEMYGIVGKRNGMET
jgi:hypothetical protein